MTMGTAVLQYLDFDFSEDEHGLGSFDALLGTIRSIDGIRDSETSLLLSSATI